MIALSLSVVMAYLTVLAVTRVRQTAAITCYTCSGSFDLSGTSSNPDCSQLSLSRISIESNCNACTYGINQPTIAGGTPGQVTTFMRECDRSNLYYGAASGSSCNGEVCRCTTELCNGFLFNPQGSLNCYACASSSLLDTGCGPVLNTNSPYVKIIYKCLSCSTQYISPIIDSEAAAFSRSGNRFSLHVNDIGCTTVSGNAAADCNCNTNLCNSGLVSGMAASRSSTVVPLGHGSTIIIGLHVVLMTILGATY